MSANINMKRIFLTLFTLLIAFSSICQVKPRQRNIIYVLDCTGSMNGYNGAPDIWNSTKDFLHNELNKEAKENPNSKVTILPFQEKVLNPVSVDLNNIVWPKINAVLDGYVKQLTATNICDSWLKAEKYIDRACDNYIVLMTDGKDNIGGDKNIPQRSALLEKTLKDFCGKYQNTKGFYVQLTAAASLPEGIQNAIDICEDLYNIDATTGIPSFGCTSDNVINVNTRDLPADITLGFSNSGTFPVSLKGNENPYLTFSIKDNKIAQGKVVLHIESKMGDKIDSLNKAIGVSSIQIPMSIESDDVIITNPDITVVVHTTPLRTLNIPLNAEGNLSAQVERVKPFLWIKGNPSDTLRWDLNPKFDEAAKDANSTAMFVVSSDHPLDGCSLLFNGSQVSADSTIVLYADQKALIELVVPQQHKDFDVNLSLREINVNNLDRINNNRPENVKIPIIGSVDTSLSIVEIIIWSLLALIVIFLLVWFGFLRNSIYPKFKRGIINIQSPYFATIRVKGYRLVLFTPHARKQGMFDRIWKGKILYHTNPAWQNEAGIYPSGKNMRFRCESGSLVCDPSPLLMKQSDYKIISTNDPSFKIDININ